MGAAELAESARVLQGLSLFASPGRGGMRSKLIFLALILAVACSSTAKAQCTGRQDARRAGAPLLERLSIGRQRQRPRHSNRRPRSRSQRHPQSRRPSKRSCLTSTPTPPHARGVLPAFTIWTLLASGLPLAIRRRTVIFGLMLDRILDTVESSHFLCHLPSGASNSRPIA